MEDRCLFFDSETYPAYGIEKREILKANSPGRPGSSKGSRTSFFLNQLPSSASFAEHLRRLASFLVAESVEIPIFRTPEAPYRQQVDILKADKLPQFFNST